MDDDLGMRALWLKAKPTALERCEVIDAAARSTDADLHARARAEAHKLAGSLGMYGLEVASALALALDDTIVDGALQTEDGRARVADIVRQLTSAVDAGR